MFDPTLTMGNVIEISTIAIGGIIAVVSVRNSVANIGRDILRMDADFADMKLEIKKVGDVLIQMAKTGVRLDNVEQDIRELRHGEGFVRKSINREYP